jgi:hypothetical protein
MSSSAPTNRTLGPIGDKILFENDQVRVWSVNLAPGQRQSWHRHDLPYLIVPLTKGKNIMYFDMAAKRRPARRSAKCYGGNPEYQTNFSTSAIGTTATCSSR